MSRRRSADTGAIREWTDDYEKWLSAQLPFVVEEDLFAKHERMAESPFVFLRATYYAWARQWTAALPELAEAPGVVAVGDLHLENFGTWRDTEGRLAWGINDFDEASVLPYTNDLVRLAASVTLAYDAARIRTPAGKLAQAFLDGYGQCLEAGGRAIVLGEGNRRLKARLLKDLIREICAGEGKKKSVRRVPREAPADCRAALEEALPAGSHPVTLQPRVAGVGSLGRPRFLATRAWNGAPALREAKARVASAAVWAGGPAPAGAPYAFDLLLRASARSADPFLHLSGRWVVRRLAADTEKIEFKVKKLSRPLELELATLMGRETANVHVASAERVPALLDDLKGRPRGWLIQAALHMAELTRAGHKAWKKVWKAERKRAAAALGGPHGR